jgi:hypothetical protein
MQHAWSYTLLDSHRSLFSPLTWVDGPAWLKMLAQVLLDILLKQTESGLPSVTLIDYESRPAHCELPAFTGLISPSKYSALSHDGEVMNGSLSSS